MNKRLVFAHMMKTAGTSLSKQLIAHFGSRMHIVPGGLRMDANYNLLEFENDLKKTNYKLQMISGHPMRPHIDFGKYEKELMWFTFFREPTKRYVSHYFYDYKYREIFTHKRNQGMKNHSIVEWEKLQNYSNYQTKFIAGEENYDKAVEILEKKIDWVGLTEEYEESLYSFKSHFELSNFYFEIEASNTNLADKESKNNVHNKYFDFITEKNSIDIRLYNYVKEQIWPKYKIEGSRKNIGMNGKSAIKRKVNTLLFHINRQLLFKTSDINFRNIKRFYKRWYR